MRLKFTARAVRDLRNIREYIARDNPVAARRVKEQIISSIRQLEAFQGKGRPGRVSGTREIVIPTTPYLVPYRVRNEVMETLAVYHAARKWPDEF
jgi:toxin ParE1/3/4